MHPKRQGIYWYMMDLPGRALVGSRTGSSDQCEADPARLGTDLKLNFGYVVEDINTHLLQKESPHLARKEWVQPD
jgi:hypothetical protein